MKIKKLLQKKSIFGLIVFAILLVFIWGLFRGMVAAQPERKYVFINDNIESELIKSKIYIAAESCDSSYFEKISNISREDLKKYSKYSIKYGDEELIPQNIVLYDKEVSKIILCTFNTNEAKRNKIIEFFESLNDIRVVYQRENTGVLYCNDMEFLREYCVRYGKGIAYGDKLTIIPIKDNVYFFTATQFVS